jgi:hypothetical protein
LAAQLAVAKLAVVKQVVEKWAAVKLGELPLPGVQPLLAQALRERAAVRQGPAKKQLGLGLALGVEQLP